MLQAVFVPYAIHHLRLAPAGVGITLAAYGFGMVIGALAAPRMMARLSLGTVVAIGPITGFAAALVMVLTIAMPSAILAGLAFLLLGAGPIVWVVSTTTLRQIVTPAPLLGRISAFSSLANGARPIGAALGGAVGSMFGAEVALILAALGFLAQMLLILLSPVVRQSAQPSGQETSPIGLR